MTIGEDGTLGYVENGPGGRTETGVVADSLDLAWAAQFARRMAPLRLVSGGVSTRQADSSRLVELLEGWVPDSTWAPLGTVDALGVRRNELLAGPIGVADTGEILTLDLKEAAYDGLGPHGILVGATGTGKSELLRSLCASLAWRHDPSLLNLLLVDFKGGAAFAELGDLPHCAGLVTNLADQTAPISRVSQALTGELTHRQELLRSAGNLSSISEYQQARTTNPALPNLPYLAVVVDEFGELLAVAPDFLDTFIAIGRLGRSLGIHLLLATQRLDEGRIQGLEPHLRYRLCLRTNTAAESRSVLGSTAAYELPSFPGLGLLQVDGGLRPFKAAIVSLPGNDASIDGSPSERLFRPLSLSLPERRATTPANALPTENTTASPTDLQTLVGRCQTMSNYRAAPVWLDPLPSAITLGRLEQIYRDGTSAGTWDIPLGLVDLPAERSYALLSWDLASSGGNLGIAGGPRSGKTAVLRSAVIALAQQHRPDQVHIYLLDLAGSGMFDLAGLPHVGAVIGRQPEAAQALLNELNAVVAERVAAQSSAGDDDRARIFLVIDGAGTLRQTMPDIETAVTDLAITGLAQGVHVAVATNRWFDLRPQLIDALGTRLELHLGDPADSMLNRAVAAAIPPNTPGRGLTHTGHQFQAALTDLADKPSAVATPDAALAAAVASVRAHAGPLHAPTITSLPLHVTGSQLVDLAAKAGSAPPDPGNGFVLGMSETRARPAQLDLTTRGVNLVIYGDAGSGRTTLIRRIASYLADRHDLDIYLIDPRRTSIDLAAIATGYAPTVAAVEKLAVDISSELANRRPPSDLTLDQLRAGHWWSGHDVFVIVDDYDLAAGGSTSNPLAPLGEFLSESADLGFHVVIARHVTGSTRSAYEPFSQRLKECTPVTLILSGPSEEGPLASGITARPRPPGRGVLVTTDIATTIQLIRLSSAQAAAAPG